MFQVGDYIVSRNAVFARIYQVIEVRPDDVMPIKALRAAEAFWYPVKWHDDFRVLSPSEVTLKLLTEEYY